MDFLQVDVFADRPFIGNALAVFPEPGDLERDQMQAIAREMNLSETTFVTGVYQDSYDVRIFTPHQELPFAGHPTLGTAWALAHTGRIRARHLTQRSKAGETAIVVDTDRTSFERQGHAHDDLEEHDRQASSTLARALGIDEHAIGLEARELGRPGRLRPALANAGLDQLMVPVATVESLSRCAPDAASLARFEAEGVYCFTAVGAGRLRARGFFPGVGVAEDPATGSAAAALGIYLAARIGAIEAEILQGVEMGRPSKISLRADGGRAVVAGRCALALTGRLEALP